LGCCWVLLFCCSVSLCTVSFTGRFWWPFTLAACYTVSCGLILRVAFFPVSVSLTANWVDNQLRFCAEHWVPLFLFVMRPPLCRQFPGLGDSPAACPGTWSRWRNLGFRRPSARTDLGGAFQNPRLVCFLLGVHVLPRMGTPFPALGQQTPSCPTFPPSGARPSPCFPGLCLARQIQTFSAGTGGVPNTDHSLVTVCLWVWLPLVLRRFCCC